MKKALKSCSICLIIIAMISTTAFAAAPNDLADPQSNSYILKTTVAVVALGNGVIEVDCGIPGKSYYAIVYFYAGKGNGSGGHWMKSSVITAK